MNWDAVGAIGEVVGALAVVISIIYLAAQIRQNTKAARLDAEREVGLYYANILREGAHTDMPGLYLRGADGLLELSEEDTAKFGFWVLGFLRFIQYAFDQRQEGNLSDSTWESIELGFKTQFQAPGVQEIWQVRGNTFKQSFRNYVDTLQIDESYEPPSVAFREILSEKR